MTRGPGRVASAAIVLASALAAAGCRERSRTERDASPSVATPTGAPSEEACLDAWLAARGLDAYGSAAGTVYAGGSPLFDEATGTTRQRAEHVYRRHPEAARACARSREDAAPTPRSPGRPPE